MAHIDHEMLEEFASLKLRVRELDAEKRDLNQRISRLEPRLLEQFEETGTRNIGVAGVGTVFLNRTGWARVKKAGEKTTEAEKRRAIEALKAAGLEQYIGEDFSISKISALFREMDKAGESLPPELDGAIEFDTGYELKVLKAGR